MLNANVRTAAIKSARGLNQAVLDNRLLQHQQQNALPSPPKSCGFEPSGLLCVHICVLSDMAFEWDEEKRRTNLQDHGVDSEDAALIFENPVIEVRDNRVDYGEPRFRALGHVESDFFMVAYTWRGGNRRIISAWKVDDDGRKRYEAILSRRP